MSEELAPGERVRLALLKMAETYGWVIADEPQRCEAMLRDLAPGCNREVFLVVAALKEQVVAELLQNLPNFPEDAAVARAAHRLVDGICLTEDGAAWAVESWLPAARLLATTPKVAPRMRLENAASELTRQTGSGTNPLAKVDWHWAALSAAAFACSLIAATVIARAALFHHWVVFSDWFADTSILTVGLCISGFALHRIALQNRDVVFPGHDGLNRYQLGSLKVADIAVLLAVPIVPAGAVAIWIAEWTGAVRLPGQSADLAFHFGRIIQSLVLAGFEWQWIGDAAKILSRVSYWLSRHD